ncbi:MAG: ribonuclease HII [Pseudomonadota bacterium]|nr:ribonuclease HII [Pseudomonadota bacterium]
MGHLLAGVDEAGRGPLAGDVVAAAVILDPLRPIAGLADSKILTEKKREVLFDQIYQQALVVAIGRANVAEIDQLNILWASMLAMHRAVDALAIRPEFVVVDGNRLPKWDYSSQAVVKGDQRMSCISAASIIAKVTRDRDMSDLASVYPDYGFNQHKGYPTALHKAALARYGATDQHRKTFAPVKAVLDLA